MPSIGISKGAQGIPLMQIPKEWDPAWFMQFLQATGLGQSVGTYQQTFQSGPVQYAGAGGQPAGSNNLIFGNNLPNPSGTPGPALLLGTGGTENTTKAFWVITDQAFTKADAGNLLGITAGEVQPGSSQQGGMLFIIAGAADLGLGGTLQLQGGTAVSGNGGLAVLQGGNSTSGAPGDAFVIAGEAGNQGANVHLVSTELSGTPGVIRMACGSDVSHTNIMADFIPVGTPSAGAQPFGIYIYSGGGWGTAGQVLTSQGPNQPVKWA